MLSFFVSFVSLLASYGLNPVAAGLLSGVFPSNRASNRATIALDTNKRLAEAEEGLRLAKNDGFYFDNPSTDCKYKSQPAIYKNFADFSRDATNFYEIIDPDATWTVMGSHPLAGYYTSPQVFFTNTFWRLHGTYMDFEEEDFVIKPLTIFGGCDQEWSTSEIAFEGKANNGRPFALTNVWVNKWRNDKTIEVRTYIDSVTTGRLLFENEIWTNSSTYVKHTQFVPGPQGMPPGMQA